MMRSARKVAGLAAAGGACLFVLFAGLAARSVVVANGGPFVIQYPKGDPAAKGVLARLGADLRPGRETRLRVVKEELTITFEAGNLAALSPKTKQEPLPLVRVEAAYTIENPTEDEVAVDFGFPILRGIYVHPFSMSPSPDVHVDVDGKHQAAKIISNSAIYGLIRGRARAVIDRAVAADAELGRLVARAKLGKRAAREALRGHLTGVMKWSERDAALMVEYAGLSFERKKDTPFVHPVDRAGGWWTGDAELSRAMMANLGPLAAIGEQKATQLFARLASRFDPDAAASYEAIFTAWGGDVRERSVDVETGVVRAREVTVDAGLLEDPKKRWLVAVRGDPTVYARVNYFDETAKITDGEKAACKTILKNLPVVFTFAPMNLVHYQVKFPAKSTQVLTVRYRQYAYVDTRGPKSYQLAYVVHPASLWDDFGPINLEVASPEGVDVRASLPWEKTTVEKRPVTSAWRWLPRPRPAQKGAQQALMRAPRRPMTVHRATLSTPEQKKGELLLAVRADAWTKAAKVALIPPAEQAAR